MARKVPVYYPKSNLIAEYAYLDPKDRDEIAKYRWFLSKDGYAFTWIKNKRVWMHRLVMQIRGVDIRGKQVDHIDRKRLNNRRSNLRACTKAENQVNRRLKSEVDQKTGLIGVETVRVAENRGDGVILIHDMVKVGDEMFLNPRDAARAANRKLKAERGRFAYQNEIGEYHKEKRAISNKRLVNLPGWEDAATDLLRRKGVIA